MYCMLMSEEGLKGLLLYVTVTLNERPTAPWLKAPRRPTERPRYVSFHTKWFLLKAAERLRAWDKNRPV